MFVCLFVYLFYCLLGERGAVGGGKVAERELTLPDVAMELPSCTPDDYLDRGAGPSVEVNEPITCFIQHTTRSIYHELNFWLLTRYSSYFIHLVILLHR